MLFVHVGGLTEEQLWDITYPFYKSVLSELAVKLQYESISHILANPYIEGASETTHKFNPFFIDIEKSQISNRCTISDIKAAGLLK